MRYTCVLKAVYLFEFDIYTGRKKATKFGLGKSVVHNLIETLNYFLSYLLWKFLCNIMAVEKIDRFHFGIGVIWQNRKLPPEIQKSKTKTKKKRSSWKNKTTCFQIKDEVVVLNCKNLESSNAPAKLYRATKCGQCRRNTKMKARQAYVHAPISSRNIILTWNEWSIEKKLMM